MKEVIAGVPLAQYAAVTAALAEAFPLRAVLSVEGLDAARWAEADRGWTARLAEDPALLARYEVELAAAQDRLHAGDDPEPREEGAAKPPPARSGKARLTSSGTGLTPAVKRTGAFAVAPPAPPAPAPAPPPVPRAPPPQSSDDAGTLTAFEVPGLILPFRPAPSPEAPSGPLESGTLVAFKLPVPGELLPFHDTPSREFQEALERPAAAPGEGSDGATVALRGAAALRSLPIHEVPPLPWDLPARPDPSRADPARLPPPAPPPPKHAPMSLERHASLCLEMAVDPAHAADALARYQVSAADKARADAYYRARIAADPEVRAQWNHAYTVYHAWFTSRPRP